VRPTDPEICRKLLHCCVNPSSSRGLLVSMTRYKQQPRLVEENIQLSTFGFKTHKASTCFCWPLSLSNRKSCLRLPSTGFCISAT